nr:protein STICHEL-like 2 isoform X1 [Tanacetum cinerariifolium]GEX90178.1 protein STICHEL-like 2 isoform X1 [Tanacetum cinerariifolium]
MDGRRHSVDLPISKTLIALRRVRSLRDPDTNSLSRLSGFVDNLNWETNSRNEVVLEQVNDEQNELGLFGQTEDNFVNWETYRGQTTHKPKLRLCKKTDQSGLLQASQPVICENKSLSKRFCDNYNDLPCMMPTSDYMEGAGSCNESIEVFLEAERRDRNEYKRSKHRKQYKSSKVVAGDIISCVSSPCLSISDASYGGSSSGIPLYENNDVDHQDTDNGDCGMGFCWSSTPTFRELGVSKHYGNETTPFSESPICLSQKFRPKSFDEIVGQTVVSKSLLTTISSQKITSFYLFHGPQGTGKASAARVFAAALNCLSAEKKKPCGDCQECTLFFAGRSRDVKEVDSFSINQSENLRYLIKSAMLPPVSSRYKVFIVNECQLMQGSTWANLVNVFEQVSRHIVFIMITPDLSKIPRTAVPVFQRFHFLKINETDIVHRLEKICSEEGFDYDRDALDFIATRSNGSLRDAEMTLEQLTLLGKRITIPLTYELIGIVSDEELFELLAMALSSDTSNTVKRARELMRSRIDPMQLISQLANLIMDILSGKIQEGASEVKKQFFEQHTSEADLQQLNNALKILSETEKQLRASKNQTTWLTVALLQLSSAPYFNANDSSLCVRSVQPRGSGASADESLKYLVVSQCGQNNGCESEKLKDKVALELIWNRALEICKSVSLSIFLRRRGNLASVCFHQGLAVVELEFRHPKYVSKAEKSWKLIASALQAALGCNVEIRICHTDYRPANKAPFSLFRCARRNKLSNQNEANISENINVGGLGGSHTCLKKAPARTIRNSDGNALSVDFSSQELRKHSSCCYPGSVKHHKKIRSLDTSTNSEVDNNLALSFPRSMSYKTCSCSGDTCVSCGLCKKFTCCSMAERPKKDSKVHCWKSPMYPLKKAWQLRLRQQGA